MRDIYCKQLLVAIKLAQDNGMEAYSTMENAPLRQVYLVGGNNICVCVVYCGGVRFSTVHRYTSQSASGFGMGARKRYEKITIEEIRESFVVYPKWVRERNTHPVEKYKNWKEFVDAQFASDYYELEIL